MRNNYTTGPLRGPHMEDCPEMGFTTEPGSRSCNCKSTDAPYSLCQLTEKIIDDAGMALVAKEELAGMRADRERLECIIANKFSLFRCVRFDAFMWVVESPYGDEVACESTLIDAIDAARGAK